MTMPEVLISVVVSGLLVAGMAAASRVVLSQNDNTGGRLNNARSQQAIGVWLPGDLASAEFVDDSPSASPCGANCPPDVTIAGSNTLLLRWTGAVPNPHYGTDGDTRLTLPTATAVSYRYLEGDDGLYDIVRVEFVAIREQHPSPKPECVGQTIGRPCRKGFGQLGFEAAPRAGFQQGFK